MSIFNKLRIQTKVNIIAILIIASIAFSSFVIFTNVEDQDHHLSKVAGSADLVVSQLIPLNSLIAKIRLDAAEVQQFFSDYGATRAEDGLGDGIENAAKAAKEFHENIEAAAKIASALKMVEVAEALEEAEKAFKPYYETGATMAKAYVSDGTKGGNGLMPQFDKAAEGMDEGIAKLEKVVTAVSAKEFGSLQSAITGIQADSSRIMSVTVISGAVLVGVASLLILFLLFGVTRPLVRVRGVMLELAEGGLDVEPIYVERRDEIGEMAKTLQVFRSNSFENMQMKMVAEQEAWDRQQRQEEADELTNMFASGISGVLEMLSGASTAMAETAQSVDVAAKDTDREVDVVTGAVEQAHGNSQAVAAASQQLSAAIGEISRLIDGSARVAQEGTQRTREVESKVIMLREASSKIGEIIQIISEIAAQTNLLALNATIEAARAGDAGKGFAVVAGEVKNLAGQTQKATVDISSQISAIQDSIAGTVGAIQAVGTVVAQIHQSTSEIAAAVTEQHSATDEIARNIQFVSSNAEDISMSIGKVRDSASRTNIAASLVRASSTSMARQTERMSAEIHDFLSALGEAASGHKFERMMVNLPARITMDGRSQAVVVMQMSVGGAWLGSTIDLPAGEQVELNIEGISRTLRPRISGTSGSGTRLQFPLDANHLEFMAQTLEQIRAQRA